MKGEGCQTSKIIRHLCFNDNQQLICIRFFIPHREVGQGKNKNLNQNPSLISVENGQNTKASHGKEMCFSCEIPKQAQHSNGNQSEQWKVEAHFCDWNEDQK